MKKRQLLVNWIFVFFHVPLYKATLVVQSVAGLNSWLEKSDRLHVPDETNGLFVKLIHV